MRSSFAILCVWLCFNVDASTPNGCSEIPEVENAELAQSSRKNNYSDGDKLDYNCKHGYASSLNITYICRDNKWTKSHAENCSQATCPLNTTVENVKIERLPDIKGPVEQGHKLIFSCIGQGLILKGQKEITCQSNGEWSSLFPKCEGCSEIPEVENAEVSQSPRKENYSNGDTLVFKCKHGYVSPQKIIYICSMNNWTKLRGAKCSLKRCELPEDIPNGRYILKGSNFVFGTTIKYICRDGYQMMSRFDTRTCRDGGWDNQLPVCEEITCVPDQIEENMRVEGLPDYDQLIRYGHRLTFSCIGPGHILNGSNKITCQSNGQWSNPFPKCEVKRCELPEEIPNGRYTILKGSNFVFGTTIKYICRDGYQIKSRFDTRTCRDGGWDNQLPACEEPICVINLPANMRSDVTEVSIRPGRTITLSCVGKGTKLQGQSKITCLARGEWNAPFPKCASEKCEQPPQVEFADTSEMIKPEYNSRERVEYTCFDKYTLDLDPPYSKYLTCEQGEWRGNIRCLKPCSVTVEDMDDRGIQLKWRGREKIFSPHRDRIAFACMKGKRLIGSDSTLIQYCNDGVMDLPQCV